MARKQSVNAAGSVVVLENTSRILAGNPLGDSPVRRTAVWLPPGYDRRRARHRAALSGSLRPRRLHRLRPRAPELEAVQRERARARRAADPRAEAWARRSSCFPDCFTSLGGNQYVNSTAIGDYADYLTREIIPLVDQRVPHARGARASRLLRQIVRRLRRDHPRHEVRAALGRDRRIIRAMRISISSTGTTGRTR